MVLPAIRPDGSRLLCKKKLAHNVLPRSPMPGSRLELEAGGGVAGRSARYRANHTALMRGMAELGFEVYLVSEDQSPIITAFRYPEYPRFRFEEFYARLSQLGFIIYPGKLTAEPCFRIGTIGRLSPPDIEALLTAMRRVLGEMGVAPGVRAVH
jgi:2-aminoethylphosphonate-pyruvate transaminase